MKEITTILLILIAVIGIISIIIVKLYYRDKEKDEDKEKLEEFINSTKADYDNEKRKRTRQANRNRAKYTQAQDYSNTINQTYQDRRRALVDDEVENVGGTTALLRQRAKAMEAAPKKQKRVERAKASTRRKVQRTPKRVQAQMNQEEEVKSFQEPIKPVHTATINSARQEEERPKARQVPMTEKQKEFISSDANKLVVEDTDSEVKVVKSVLPSSTIEEMKESAKIEEETAKVEEKDEVVKKAEADTAELIQKIEEAKGVVEETLSEEDEVEETPTIESTIEKIKQASKEKEEEEAKADATEEEKPAFIDSSSKVSEIIAEVQEEETSAIEAVEAPADVNEIPTIEVKAEEEIPTIEVKAEEEIPTIEVEAEAEEAPADGEKIYNDDLHILLNKDEQLEEVDDTPENEFITINSDAERSSTGNELINSAIQSIRNFRKPNVPEEPVVEELKDDIVPDDYAQDLGGGIEYIGDTITITPIHEEERDLANNQPNEDVDKIYKEINKESYNKTDDEELSDSFEDVDDETSEKDANIYTEEDYKKVEAKEKEKKRRAENTRKILGSKGISEDELRRRSEAKAKSRRTRKAAVAEEPVEEGQKRLVLNKTSTDVEEVYINGTLFELKVGQVVIFDIKGESYSSQILRLKPGYIGVRYRSKKIWVKSNSVKKILK